MRMGKMMMDRIKMNMIVMEGISVNRLTSLVITTQKIINSADRQ